MDFEKEKQLAQKYAERVKQKQELKEIKHKNDKEKKPLTFSKIAFIFLILNCSIVEIYSMIVMIKMYDLSALTTLISAVVGECIVYCAYIAKSTIENKSEGIIFEAAKHEWQRDDEPVG